MLQCGGLWGADAALAALSLAASLGNLVRLPRLVLQYGGGKLFTNYFYFYLSGHS